MLIIKVGTRLRERVDCEKHIKSFGVSNNITLKNAELSGVSQYLNVDIFGDRTCVYLEDWNNETHREYVYRFLEEMSLSQNIFVIDEAEILDVTLKKISKYAEKVFDAREGVVKNNIFDFVNYFYFGDKKNAWLEYNRLLNSGEKIEGIAGAVNWKLNTSKNKKHRELSFEILKAVAMDHDGKCDGEKEIEKIILKI